MRTTGITIESPHSIYQQLKSLTIIKGEEGGRLGGGGYQNQ